MHAHVRATSVSCSRAGEGEEEAHCGCWMAYRDKTSESRQDTTPVEERRGCSMTSAYIGSSISSG